MLQQFVLTLLILYLKSYLTDASPRIYLKEIDLKDNSHTQDKEAKSVLTKALNLIQKGNLPQQAAVNRCVLRNKDMKNKLHCITDLVEKREKSTQVRAGLDENNDYLDLYPEFFINRAGRSKNFSQDYVDINDLLRTDRKTDKKRKIVFKIVNPDEGIESSDENFRRFNSFVNKKILRTVSDDDSDSSDSDTRKKIHYSTESSSDENSGENERVKGNSVMYMQSPSRLYHARRRLPHFLPKRYHWSENDMKNLRNYWISGPQGQYWGLHKTPY